MADDDWDDECWSNEDDVDEVPCPECGAAIYDDANQCPECGYWLTEADQRATDRSQPVARFWQVVAVVVLVTFLASVFWAGFLF